MQNSIFPSNKENAKTTATTLGNNNKKLSEYGEVDKNKVGGAGPGTTVLGSKASHSNPKAESEEEEDEYQDEPWEEQDDSK